MELYFDYIPVEIITNLILPKIKMMDLISVINFNEKQYEDIFRVKFEYAYNVLRRSKIKFTCEERTWKELITSFSKYEYASDPDDDPFDILSYYYIKYLKGEVDPIMYLSLDDWETSSILRSAKYRDHIMLNTSCYYPKGIAIDIYKDTLYQDRHIEILLILIALDIHNFDIFEIMMKDIYDVPRDAFPDKLALYFASFTEKYDDIIVDRIIDCSYFDFNDIYPELLARFIVAGVISFKQNATLSRIFIKYKDVTSHHLDDYLQEAAEYSKNIVATELVLSQEGNISIKFMKDLVKSAVMLDSFDIARLILNDKRFPRGT